MRLRTPLAVAVGRKLRICIVVRFSTDEQRKRRRSNASQIKYIQKHIGIELAKAGITNYEYIVVADEAVSGELKDREGIFELRRYIADRRIDVIVCEDSSRLYRNHSFCFEIIAGAYDKGIRTICLGDDIDTEERDWELRLQEAQAHHCKDNAYTRRRLARAFEDLWEEKAAVGPLRPGHLRKATRPATELSEAEGPFYDSLDPAHVKHIACAFKLVSSRRDPDVVTRYLTKRRVPKTNLKIGEWTVRQLIELIRNPVYRGQEHFRNTKARQTKLTGKTRQEKSKPSEVWIRDMPHLRVVSDGLWHAANAAIDARRKGSGPPTGEAHPHFGVPRSSTTPTSGLMFCGICGGKMYCIGTSYRCQSVHQVRGAESVCWNHATCSRELTDERLYARVLQELLDTEGKVDVVVEGLASMLEDRREVKARERQLGKEIDQLQRRCFNLKEAIEARERKPATIVDQIIAYEEDIAQKSSQLEDVRTELLQQVAVPDCDDLRGVLREAMAVVPNADHRARGILKELLAGRIEVFPYRQFDSDRIVLRAHFTLNLVNICPDELRQSLSMNLDWARNATVLQAPCVVDLFKTPDYIKHALAIYEATKTRKIEEVAPAFGVCESGAKRARVFGKTMTVAQLTDPYVRLYEAPRKGSRWHRFNRGDDSKELVG